MCARKGVQTFFLSYKISFMTISFYGEHEKDLWGGGTDFWVHPSTVLVLYEYRVGISEGYTPVVVVATGNRRNSGRLG